MSASSEPKPSKTPPAPPAPEQVDLSVEAQLLIQILRRVENLATAEQVEELNDRLDEIDTLLASEYVDEEEV